MCCVNAAAINTTMHCIRAPPLMEVHRYNAIEICNRISTWDYHICIYSRQANELGCVHVSVVTGLS